MRRFFNWIVPLIKKHALPAVASLGKTAINAAADIAKDTVAGRNFKEAAQDRINTGVDTIKEQVERKLKLEGEGIKRKKKFKKYVILKKQKKTKNVPTKQFKDIFD